MEVIAQHVLVGFANPFLICEECKATVRYWHNVERCNCEEGFYLHPCNHKADVVSTCMSWGPVDGCSCVEFFGKEKPCSK